MSKSTTLAYYAKVKVIHAQKRFLTLTPGSEKVWASSEGGGIGGGAVAVGLPGLPWGLALTATPRQTRARKIVNFMVE